MNKIALVFPGQGSQYVGMAKDLYENNSNSKKLIDNLNDLVEVNLKEIMFNGSDEKLAQTENTQPALLIHSISLFEALKAEVDLKFHATLGLSLGEYSALVASKSLDINDATKLVRKRGKLMDNCVPKGKGAMAAILGLDRDTIKNLVKTTEGTVDVANFNCPGQIVISGEVNAVEEAMEKCKEYGAKRAVKLNVSGPFHSSMLKKAGDKLSEELENIEIKEPEVKVLSNVNADYYKDNIKELLVKQVSSSVLFEDSIEKLLDEGFDTFIEIGPGKTLKGFIKKISSNKNKKVNLYNIDTIDSLKEFVEIYRKAER